MKPIVAIVAGGDSSELPVSLRSAQGLYSFIDKEKYDLYIVEMQGLRWEVQLPGQKGCRRQNRTGTRTSAHRSDQAQSARSLAISDQQQALIIRPHSRGRGFGHHDRQS